MLEASYHVHWFSYLYSSGAGNCQRNIVCLSLDAPWRDYDLIHIHASNAIHATSESVAPSKQGRLREGWIEGGFAAPLSLICILILAESDSVARF
jgi:hypothetical protein